MDNALFCTAGFIVGILVGYVVFFALTLEIRKDIQKLKFFYRLLVRWMLIKVNDKEIYSFFYERHMKKIIIYGMKELGEILYADLKHADLDIVQIIDRDADKMYVDADMHVSYPDDLLENADVIVVTAVTEFDSIKDNLSKKTKTSIVSLSQITGSFDV